MNDQERSVLAYERAVNDRYVKELDEMMAEGRGYQAQRNAVWVRGHPDLGIYLSDVRPLLGRVGLDPQDELLGTDFYVGPWHSHDGDVHVYNWLAPAISSLFYQPDSTDPAASSVVVRRTFDNRLLDLVGYVDDCAVDVPGSDPFKQAGPAVPPAPELNARRRTNKRPAFGSPSSSSGDEPATPVEPLTQAVRHDSSKPVPPTRVAAPVELTTGMRAVEVVLDRLRSPRGDRLHSVLSTLQPDQHELSLAPAGEALIIQGHPGTGKTIIAAHRVAYLSDDEDGAGLSRVLLVGPTGGYVRHVLGLIAPLTDPGRVRVAHVEELLLQVRGTASSVGGALDGRHDDRDTKAGGLADRAKRMLERRGELASGRDVRAPNLKKLYELLRSNGTTEERISGDPETHDWLSKLPSFEQVSNRRRYLPLLARCALAIQPIPPTDRFDHIVVDEAQDVSQIEWGVLEQFLRPGCEWTLIGDMNQRRSDATYMSWDQIADHLGLGTEDRPAKVTVITRGYRSTDAILKFADRLLPVSERGATSLQTQGAPVKGHYVASATAEALHGMAVQVANQLCATHVEGTVAIITVDPGSTFPPLFADGWRRVPGRLEQWTKAEQRLSVLVPEDARGLEFDAVAVVEPADFPENLGRTGQLYTSMTRANRELRLLHHKRPPDALRKALRH